MALEVTPAGVMGAAEEREACFAAFVERHRARAVGLAWRLVGGDRGVAEDVAQDAFVRAWRGLPRFRQEASLETWFYRILVRRAADQRRWSSVRERWGGSADPDVVEAVAGRPDVATDPPLQRRIAEALDTLTRRQRECFVLVHLEGFSIAETAGLLHKPVGTVKSHLHRALVKLRRQLADLGPAAPMHGTTPDEIEEDPR